MSIDHARAFVSKVREDQKLQQQFIELETDDRDAMLSSAVRIGKSNGFEFTSEEIYQVWEEHQSEGAKKQKELNEEELDSVVGGCYGTNYTKQEQCSVWCF